MLYLFVFLIYNRTETTTQFLCKKTTDNLFRGGEGRR